MNGVDQLFRFRYVLATLTKRPISTVVDVGAMSSASRSRPRAPNREVQELSLLLDISRSLDETLELREVLGPVLEQLSARLGLRRGMLCLLDQHSGEISIDLSTGLTARQQKRGLWRFGEGITGEVIQSGEPCLIPRTSQDARFLNQTGSRITEAGEDLAFVCVPIRLDGKPVGTLSADRVASDDRDLAHDARLLTIIATMIAEAVRLRREARREAERLERENKRLQQQLATRFRPANIIGNSKAMRTVYELTRQVAVAGTNVLLLGESGTGKELVAHAIHYNSPRASMPFIKVNCAALPESIIESELFGHEQGAFTGATSQRKGRFEMADGGTLFLDEVAELSSTMQAKLLRVLQEGELDRVGGSGSIRVDVRMIAATNQDLEKRVDDGTFRRDLYYRIHVFPIALPPLRERRTDILQLVDHFIERFNVQLHKEVKRVSTPAIDMLLAYHWPGNVRELENCIERAMLLSKDGVIHGHHLPPTLQTAEASDTAAAGTLKQTLTAVERELIIESLKATGGNMAESARQLGISERIIGLRIRRYGIEPKRFRH